MKPDTSQLAALGAVIKEDIAAIERLNVELSQLVASFQLGPEKLNRLVRDWTEARLKLLAALTRFRGQTNRAGPYRAITCVRRRRQWAVGSGHFDPRKSVIRG